jgi:hypothetical protein
MTTPAVIPEISTPPSPYQVPQAFSLVIFGASGDLARRKLFPALYALAHDNLLPERFAVIGFARREKSHEAFREEIRAAVDEFSRFRARAARGLGSAGPRDLLCSGCVRRRGGVRDAR